MKILIVGDVGTGKDGWYHIGDEAMLSSNVKNIRNSFPASSITILSRSISHGRLKIDAELINNDFNGSRNKILKLLLYWLKINILTRFIPRTDKLYKIISNQNHILFSGGGNLNSLFPEFLYNRTKLAIAATASNIPFELSGQTLGPIYSSVDLFLLRYILGRAVKIGLRDKSFSIKYINNPAIANKIVFKPDDAYHFSTKLNIGMPKNDNLNIGVSLRDWDNPQFLERILSSLNIFISRISQPFRLYLIPHIIDKHDRGDLVIMKKLFKQYDFTAIDYRFINKFEIYNPEEIIYEVTKNMDILITSRYHGLIFGLSSETPTLAAYNTEYYKMKIIGAFETVSPNLKNYYHSKLTSEQETKDFGESIYRIYQNNYK